MSERKPNNTKKQKQVEVHTQRALCRVESGDWKYGGYRKDNLTENLTEREVVLLICDTCKGIMREPCLTSSGEQFCSCCVQDPQSQTTKTNSPLLRSKYAKRPSKQTPNTPVRKMIDSLKCSCPLWGRGCQWLGTLKKCEEHLDICGYVQDQCKLQCGAVLQRNELRMHEEEGCPLCIVKCKHCKGDLQLGDMPTHLEACPRMEVSCKLACGVVMCREDMTQHLMEECGMMGEICNLGCGMMITRNGIKKHLTDTCVQRLIQCQHCQREVKFGDMPNHLEVCPKMEVSCELKCNTIMPRENMAQHLEQECGMVVEMCELGCGMEMTRNELKIHVTDTCVQRMIQCGYCNGDVEFLDMPNHLDVCPKKEVSCELKCGTLMPRHDMVQHLEQECGMVVEMCELGCGTEVTRNKLKIHVTDTCILRLMQCEYCNNDVEFREMPNHLDVCPKMKVSCELACGVIMCRENLKHHLEEFCPEKELACPFVKYKCEVGLLKRKYLSQHLEEKRTEHLELKLNAMEEIILKQSEEIRTYIEESKQHRDEIIHLKLEQTQLKNSFAPITMKCQEEMTIQVNKLSEQINTLCSINNTTKLEWKIEDITEFINTVYLPQKDEFLNGVILNTHFLNSSICVSFGHEHGIDQRTVIAKFTICLFSNTEMKAMKRYKHEISQFLIGDIKREIAHIPNSDIQELFCIGATDIILEMYVTIM